jgi:glycosyltransferase involved in cell wall biosynthesis
MNERDTIHALLNSLLAQSVHFDELILVDGGSTDGTAQILTQYSQRHKNIRVFTKKGNIAVGRNFGVKYARNQVLAFIDGGCVAQKNWLEKLTHPFVDKKVQVVAGFYRMKTSNMISKAAAAFHGITPRRFNRATYMPSARSFAITKRTYNKVGGFNEGLYKAGEDTLFNYKIVKLGISITRVPEAKVTWTAPETISSFAKKSYFYALGDAQTRIWWHPAQKFKTHSLKILFIFVRYLFFFFLLGLSLFSSIYLPVFVLVFLFYLALSIWKVRRDVPEWKVRLVVPLVQIVSDFSVMVGFATGLLFFPKISV